MDPDKVAKLKDLKELLDAGVLTQEEFEAQKRMTIGAGTRTAQANPVMMQPVQPMQPMMQPMMQPGMIQSPWVGNPPPKESASTWWGMYKADEGRSKIGPDGRFVPGSEPDDCGNCCFAWHCQPCAAAEVKTWATDGAHPYVFGVLEFMLCTPCELSSTRGLSEEKIWNFHNARGDPKAQMMPANKQKHGDVCMCWFLMLMIPCVNCVAVPLVMQTAGVENYSVMKKFQLARQREQEAATAPQPMSMGVCA